MMKITVLDRNAIGADTPLEGLKRFGDVEIYNSTSSLELHSRIKSTEILILNKVKISRADLEICDKLKLICIFATGYDNVDVRAAKERGVAVCNVPGYSTDSVALFTVANVLALCTHLREYNNFVVSGEYSSSGLPNRLVPVYHEIAGKTWGIIGLGNIGKAVARVAQALGARVIANKRNTIPEYECVDIDILCRESDIITVHCPLNDESRNLISRERIGMMKENVIIVNEARGAVVDEYAVTEAIKNKKIGAYGSDVYTSEPFDSDHPFYEIKDNCNVLFTPHAAWGSYEARVRCINIICRNIESFLGGGKENRVN